MFIIYQNDEGGVSIIRPTEEAINFPGINAVALKDVPAGKPFKFVDAESIPADRTFRAAWCVNESDLTDGIGADYGVGSANEVIGWNSDATPILKETQR